jgi:type IV pilus assembly protein PilW
MTRRSFASPAPRAQQSGLSLVELLVAMAVALVLLAGVMVLYASMSSATKTSSLEAQLNEDGTLSLQILKQQLQLAGYSGLKAGIDGAPNFTGVGVLGCDGGFQTVNANYMGSLPTPIAPACGATATAPDAIAIRYEADLQNTVPIAVGGVNLPSNCAYESIGPWSGGVALAENRFYIAQDATNNNVNTLYCRGIRTDSAGVTQFGAANALIPNVEDMQLTYVVSAAVAPSATPSPQVTGIVNASHAVLGTTLANWSRVAGVHICLVMRSNQTAPPGSLSTADLGFYRDCAGNAIANGTDRFLRRAFRTTVAFRNLRPDIPATYTANGDPWVRQDSGAGTGN